MDLSLSMHGIRPEWINFCQPHFLGHTYLSLIPYLIIPSNHPCTAFFLTAPLYFLLFVISSHPPAVRLLSAFSPCMSYFPWCHCEFSENPNTLLKSKRHSLRCHDFLVHACGVPTAHVHQCCRFQSYAKTVPSQMKLTTKLTKREPTFLGSMTMDHVITACDVWL